MMKKSLFLMILVMIGAAVPVLAQTADIYSCVSDVVVEDAPRRPGMKRAVFQASKKWVPGQQLRVRFLDGSQYVRSKVRQYAEIWEQYGNIDFVFVESGPAEIRVSFSMDPGSWSFHGKDSVNQSYVKRGNGTQFVRDGSGASMNFGWFNDRTPETEFRRTTLHEFGHALGLRHEHQNRNGRIEWNEEAVLAYFARQGWSEERTRTQVLDRYGNDGEITNGVYDPLSIMHYYYPPELVKGGRIFPQNTVLSVGDQAIIAELYPFDDDTVRRPTVPNPPVNKPPVVPATQPIFAFTDISADFEGYDEASEQDGMVISSDFTVKNGLRQEFTMAVYFYTAEGAPLKDSNQLYYSANGQVAAFRKFVPGYANAVYKEFEIFMPYEELELECGNHNLKYSIGVWNGPKRVTSTGFTYFELDIPCE